MFFLDFFGLNSFTLFLVCLVALYFYLTRNFNYWKSRGIDGPKPIVGFGTIYKIFFVPIPEVLIKSYEKYGKLTGTFFGSRPGLTIADPELFKDINIRDFHVFVDRLSSFFSIGDPHKDRSLFSLKGEEWKKMRSIISPTFSSGKMRRMHPIIVDCVQRLEQVLEKKAQNKEDIDLKRMMGNLTMDVIATCAFGTKIDTHNEEKTSEFVINAQKLMHLGSWRMLVAMLVMPIFPQLIKWTKFSTVDPGATQFFKSAIRSIIDRRKTGNGEYNDYLQLMINAQNKSLETEDNDEEEEEIEEIFSQTKENYSRKAQIDVTEDEVLANTLLFFIAGYETTASLLSHLFYSLAVNEKCQQKLYEEIKRFDGEFGYEMLAKMSYLEACIAETLRMYPPIPVLGRMASEDYKLGDTGLTIPKGMNVGFNCYAIHYSSEYYSEPKKWDPDRFMPENRNKLNPYAYMPFGLGPRNCVGMRFGLMEAKTATAHLINKFRFVVTERTHIPLKVGILKISLNFGDIVVGIEKRDE